MSNFSSLGAKISVLVCFRGQKYRFKVKVGADFIGFNVKLGGKNIGFALF
jgi:hypothetical protein